jgi:glycosyltransferase 2 family protein
MNHSRKLWKKAARLAFTVVVVGILFHFVDWRHVVSALAGASLVWLLPAYALVVVRRGIEVAQMTRVLRLVGCPVGWWRVFRANALAAFYALFTPGSLIPVAVKWTDLAAATGRRAIVFNAIIYSRLLLDLQPMIIGAAALAWSNPTGEPVVAVAATGLMVLGLAVALCLFSPWLSSATRLATDGFGRCLPVRLRARLDHLLDELEPFRAFPLTRHLSLALVALLGFAVGIATRLMIMKSLGFTVPISTIIWVDAMLLVASHVPITLGNFGVREGLVVAVFGLYGVPADVAVAYGLIVYSCRHILALAGAGYQLALIAGWATMRGAAPGPSESPAAIEATRERA